MNEERIFAKKLAELLANKTTVVRKHRSRKNMDYFASHDCNQQDGQEENLHRQKTFQPSSVRKPGHDRRSVDDIGTEEESPDIPMERMKN